MNLREILIPHVDVRAVDGSMQLTDLLHGPGGIMGETGLDLDGHPAVLAVGGDFIKELLVTIFTCIGSMMGGMTLAVAVVLLTFFKRRKARQARQALEVPPVMPRG